jgi:hypothetical protein
MIYAFKTASGRPITCSINLWRMPEMTRYQYQPRHMISALFEYMYTINSSIRDLQQRPARLAVPVMGNIPHHLDLSAIDSLD